MVLQRVPLIAVLFLVVVYGFGCNSGNPEASTAEEEASKPQVSWERLEALDEELFDSYDESFTSGNASALSIIDSFQEIAREAKTYTGNLRRDLEYAKEDLAKVERGVDQIQNEGRTINMDSPECSTILFPDYNYNPDPFYTDLNPTLNDYIEYSVEAEEVISETIQEAEELPGDAQDSLERLDDAEQNLKELKESRNAAKQTVATYKQTYDNYPAQLNPIKDRTDTLIDQAGCNDF